MLQRRDITSYIYDVRVTTHYSLVNFVVEERQDKKWSYGGCQKRMANVT